MGTHKRIYTATKIIHTTISLIVKQKLWSKVSG
jgi:hypothetical protein